MLTAAELRELEARATGGPWVGDRLDGTVKYGIKGPLGGYIITVDDDGLLIEPDDAALVLALRNHAKFLAAALEAAEAIDARLKHTEALDLLEIPEPERSSAWDAFRDKHTALYKVECEALSRFRAQREGG